MPGAVILAADRPSTGSSEVNSDPDFSARPEQARLVESLSRRARPVRGGQRIVGPVVAAQPSGSGSVSQTTGRGSSVGGGAGGSSPSLHVKMGSGTLGLLLADASDPDVGYGVTALHALDPANGDPTVVGIGDAVFQPSKKVDGLLSGFRRIGWVIATCPELDAALIGLKPGLRWDRRIEVEDTASQTTLVPTQGSYALPLRNEAVGEAPPTASGELWKWVASTAPVRADLPQSGGVSVRKSGQRTGRTTGMAFWSTISVNNPAYHQIPKPGPGSPTSQRTWDLLDSFYSTIRDPTSSEPDLLLDIEDDRYNPPLFLCVPDAAGAAAGDLVSFQQKGDSGAALLDTDDTVVGLICSVWGDQSGTSGWIGGLAVPIDLVVSALRDVFDQEFGHDSSADWPEPVVPTNTGPAERRVPRSPKPRWYQLLDASTYTLSRG